MKNVIVITDPNTDADDLATFVVLRHLIDKGLINLCGVVVAKGNEIIRQGRAKFTSGVFNYLNLDVPICVGADYDIKDGSNDNSFCDHTLVNEVMNFAKPVLNDPIKFIEDILNKTSDVSFLIISPMSDVASFIEYNPNLFKSKVKELVIMGNIADDGVSPCVNSYNNKVCYEAAVKTFSFAIEHGIRLLLVPRDTIYQAQVTHDFYDQLERSENLIAMLLAASNKYLVEMLWDDVREGVYPHFDVRRFAKVFLGDDFSVRKKVITVNDNFETVWQKMKYFNLYDPITAIAMMEDLFLRGGYYEQVGKMGEILIARIDKPNIIVEMLYESIVEELKK